MSDDRGKTCGDCGAIDCRDVCRHHDAHPEPGKGLVCDDCGEVVER